MKTLLNKYILEIQNIAHKGFFHLFTANGLIYVVGFASQLFVAGILEPVDIGRIKIMQTYIGLAALLGGFGFNTSLLKLASERRSAEEKADLLHLSMLVAAISFVLIFLLFFALSKSGLISNDPVISKFFPYYALFLLPSNIQSMQTAFYQAIKKIKKLAIIQLIVKFISVALIIIATYFYKLEGYIGIISITGFISVFSLRQGLLNSARMNVKLKFKLQYINMMWKLAKYALLANLLYTLLITSDIYFINYLIEDRTQVGFYMFAITIISIYQIVPRSIQQVAFPFFSSKSENHLNWLKAYKKYNQLNHILIVMLCLAGIIIFPPFIRFAFSGKYDTSISYFVTLSFGWMFTSMNIIKATALMGYGKFNINFYTSLIVLALSLPFMYILIAQYDIKGALAGRILTGAVYYGVTYVIFRLFLKKIL